ncbi:MAG: hypothetical protein KBS41_04760 [Oscillospiraceae bacterium]|nr:hypothetical protein [Candidatus Equicaccousia limihippi]
MADNTLTKGIKNIKYSLVAQAVILIIGVLKSLIVPTVLSVDEYAYWQLYLFYIGYIGICYLGFNDGILLKYGKYNYDQLPFEKMRRSMQFYMVMLVIFAAAIFGYAMWLDDPDKSFVFTFVAASVLMYGLNGVFIYIFLITNQIKRHSIFSAVDSVGSFLGILFILAIGKVDYHYLIYFVFSFKLLSVLIMLFLCRKTVFGKAGDVKEGFKEFVDNIRIGIFLMLAQIMSMLVTGLGKIFIENGESIAAVLNKVVNNLGSMTFGGIGDIKNYAYYSFGITVLNIIMVGVTAVATVMYPTLSRVKSELLPKIFNKMYDYFSHFNVLVLFVYFPAYLFVQFFFEKYRPMLSYFAIMFITISWQAKVNITTNSYFRVLRMERKMFGINALSVVCFVVSYFFISLIFKPVLNNPITIVALSTMVSMIFLEMMAEKNIRKALNIKWDLHLLLDLMVNALFILCAILPNKYIGMLFYGIIVLIYVIARRKVVFADAKVLIKTFLKKQ